MTEPCDNLEDILNRISILQKTEQYKLNVFENTSKRLVFWSSVLPLVSVFILFIYTLFQKSSDYVWYGISHSVPGIFLLAFIAVASGASMASALFFRLRARTIAMFILLLPFIFLLILYAFIVCRLSVLIPPTPIMNVFIDFIGEISIITTALVIIAVVLSSSGIRKLFPGNRILKVVETAASLACMIACVLHYYPSYYYPLSFLYPMRIPPPFHMEFSPFSNMYCFFHFIMILSIFLTCASIVSRHFIKSVNLPRPLLEKIFKVIAIAVFIWLLFPSTIISGGNPGIYFMRDTLLSFILLLTSGLYTIFGYYAFSAWDKKVKLELFKLNCIRKDLAV